MPGLKPGGRFALEIEALDDAANGIAHIDGILLRIPFAAPGDHIRTVVESVSGHRPEAWGRMLELLRPGSARRDPRCPMSMQAGGECGGCPARHLAVDAALEMKRNAVISALRGCGFDLPVSMRRANLQDGYRNRTGLVAARTAQGLCYLGSYRPRSHRVARTTGCPVLRAPLAVVCDGIAAAMNRLSVPVFPLRGGIRYVLLRASAQGKVLVELVVNGMQPGGFDRLADELMNIPGVVGVSVSNNSTAGNALRVAAATHLAGQGIVNDRFGQVSLPLSAGVFAQLNAEVAGEMYVAAARMLIHARHIRDLYCGVGGLGLNALAFNPAARLHGLESVAESIVLAHAAARNCGFDDRARFDVADLGVDLPVRPDADAVIVNPPRKGLDAPVCDMLCGPNSVSLLIYMSCNPGSFARDAAALVASGWRLNEISAFDMLPGTAHVELLARFTR